jgi:hypothetical protein
MTDTTLNIVTEYCQLGRNFHRSGQLGDRQLGFEDAGRAGQRQFADHDGIVRLIGHQLVIAREHADGDGQIKTRPLLLDIRQREVDRGAAHGILNPELASVVLAGSRDSFTAASGSPTMTIIETI